MREQPLTLYPQLIYELYGTDGERLRRVEMEIAMRVFTPDDLVRQVEDAGMEVLEKYGGYRDETCGEGRELVVSFRLKR